MSLQTLMRTGRGEMLEGKKYHSKESDTTAATERILMQVSLSLKEIF